MIDIAVKTAIFGFMCLVLLVAFPIAIVSISWEVGKDIYHGRKPKIWGMG